MNKIDMVRAEIDEINLAIIELLHRRGELSADIAALKIKDNLPLTDKEREVAQLKRLRERSGDYLSADSIEIIFRAIFDSSKEVQRRKGLN